MHRSELLDDVGVEELVMSTAKDENMILECVNSIDKMHNLKVQAYIVIVSSYARSQRDSRATGAFKTASMD